MNRSLSVVSTLTLLVPAVALAQDFKVAKYDIGGEGGTDYVTAEPGSRRVFVSRSTHVMVVDGATGKVLGDIPNTPRMHGVGIAPKWKHGFTTNAGDSSVTMFDLTTLAPIKKIAVKVGGLDGVMYDEYSDRIILTNHSRPVGTAVALDANTGEIVGTAELEDDAPEGAASDGKGKLFVNNESKNTIQVLDAKSMKVLASWPISPCDGPTGIAYDRATNRIFSGCGKTSVVVDAKTGKVVANIANGDGVDALGWDPAQKLIYIPAGRDGNVTIVHQDSPDKYTVVATVKTMPGAKTITVDPVTHTAYLFQPEFGPAPAGTPPGPGGRPARGPAVAGWFFAITH
ncbi:MAG TPA: hypothetical protein VM076_00070 [Gemmatimonadaceae bacterium]|nr:hypothetical protein [Gemmatimonadaceae bacterium]